MLGFDTEAECMVRGNDLIVEFKKAQKKVCPAVENMLIEAEKAANGETAYETYDDIFGTEE